MTVGSYSHDYRLPVATSCGQGYAGSISEKTWSGTDYPKVIPTYTSQYYWDDFRKKYRVKRWRNQLPKRARTEEHPYDVSWNRSTDPLMNWYSAYWQQWYTGTMASCWGGVTEPTMWSTGDDNILYGKLREKVAGSDFNAAVFLAEGHQSLQMITTAARRIAASWKFASRGNWLAAERALVGSRIAPRPGLRPDSRVVASNWLELQYGWLPLLSDAESGAKFLAHLCEVPFQHVVRVQRHKTYALGTFGSAFTFAKGSSVYQKSIKAILKEVDVVKLSGLSDPLSVVWEKLPYSFVADWFIPIGSFLANRGLSQALKGTFVISTKRRVTGAGIASLNADRVVSPNYRYDRGWFKREISTTLPVPLPGVKPLNEALSWRHAANAVALLTQVVTTNKMVDLKNTLFSGHETE
jgi:hypothetical protein